LASLLPLYNAQNILLKINFQILQWDRGAPMGTNFAYTYKKGNTIRFGLVILAFSVFLSILFGASVACAVVDVTLAWDASSGADGYKLFCREDGQSYNYSSPDWQGTGTTGTVSGLDESSTYHFVVRAYNLYSESGDSNEEHLYPSNPNQAPTASFIANPTLGDAPLTVDFDAIGSIDPDGTIVSYVWDFGNGGGTGMNASHTYSTAGNYTVTLTVTDDGGATDTATTTIQVTTPPIPNQGPTASLTATPSSGEAPLNVTFDGSNSSDPDGSIVSYNWDFGNGGGTGINPSHTYNNAGTYTVTLTVTDDDGATDTATTQIQVNAAPVPNQPPTASLSASPASGDSPLTVAFDGSGSSDPDGTIAAYSWDFGDGTSSTVASLSHTYDVAGTYTATLMVTDDDGATDSSSTVIQVNNPPVPNQPPTANFTAGPTSGDAPLLVSFDGSGSDDPDGSISTYSWNFGDGGSATGINATHTYNSANNYTVTLTVTDNDGASDSASTLIQVTEPPAVNSPPNQPVISSPYDGELETDLLLSVETEPFSDPDGDAHQETQWQIVKAADSSVVLEIVSNEHLTKLPVPHAVLDRNTTYHASVQFVDAHSEPSPWSDPVQFTTHNGVEDYDGDGIPDDSEVDDTVDLNADGIPDNDQPDIIKSARSAVAGKKPLGINKITASIENIELLEPIHPSEILDKKNKPKNFLYGLAAYRLRLNQVGGTVNVKVYYSEDVSGAKGFYLYDTVNGWQDYTQYTTFNPDGRSVAVELQDGGHGDSDGVANGVIVDPGGVVGAATGADSGAGGGCFIATAKHTGQHDWLQNIVRVLLMPLVGMSYIMRTSLATIILLAFMLVVSVLSFYALIYKRRKYQV
jgi:PKD repeat protein